MSNLAIKVENLGKLYRLGEVGTGTISHDINRWIAKVRGKEDPFAKVGVVNDRTLSGSDDYVWALKNVDFEIKQGEVTGIIGRNGAGKSTLLKLLSKVTQPSTGNIKVKGRIASLLEVGTGFHPEMTGRENIFLNGAIMGMTKNEIKKRFDEIVEFAGVNKYVDTPVKRYSSGMYVRLAFAVAAHLEPEILIVDEVLAVGDMEFQKKCLGKMKDVSVQDGRTVLFVSHNMQAVEKLCDTGLVLQNGCVGFRGSAKEAISFYGKSQISHKSDSLLNQFKTKNPAFKILDFTINNKEETNFDWPADNILDIAIKGTTEYDIKCNLELRIYTLNDTLIGFYAPGHLNNELMDLNKGVFNFNAKIALPENLSNGDYYINIQFAYPNVELYGSAEGIILRKANMLTKSGRFLSYDDIGFVVMDKI